VFVRFVSFMDQGLQELSEGTRLMGLCYHEIVYVRSNAACNLMTDMSVELSLLTCLRHLGWATSNLYTLSATTW